MRYIFSLFIALVATFDVCAIIYAAEQAQHTNDNGIVITREESSSPLYDFLIFTNNNKYDVVITYTVDGNIPTKVSIKAGESKKTLSAYKNSSKVSTTIEPAYKKAELKTKRQNDAAPKGKSNKASKTK